VLYGHVQSMYGPRPRPRPRPRPVPAP
jgi:hypothetical protein